MRQVYTNRDITRVGHYQSLLEEEQIHTLIRNQHDYGGPMFSDDIRDPSLWVVDNADYEPALRLIEAYEMPKDELSAEAWICPACKVEVGQELNVCWNCDTEK